MRVNMKKTLRVLLKIALCLVGLMFAYALIGTILSLIPINGNVAAGNDVVIYLDTLASHSLTAFAKG